MSLRLTSFLVLVGWISARMASGPTLGLRESFCGRVYGSPPFIEPAESIGPLRLRSSLLDLKRSCPGARDTSSLPWGRGFLLTAFGSSIVIVGDQPVLGDTADRVVTLIRVSGGTNLRTRDGLSPGSTIGDAKRKWGDLQVTACPAGVSYAYAPARPGLGLVFAATCTGVQGEVASYPDSLTIRAIEIFTPVD
jgi:hypothetical protein